MTYDAAGNQTYDCRALLRCREPDDEGRPTRTTTTSTTPTGSGSGGYSTDRRPGEETWFVYGFDGELVYAYNQVTAPPATAPQKEYGYRGGKLLVVWDGTQAGDDQLKWLVTDHLGSTRMEANKSGSLAVIRRHDYLPFGEEPVASTSAGRKRKRAGLFYNCRSADAESYEYIAMAQHCRVVSLYPAAAARRRASCNPC